MNNIVITNQQELEEKKKNIKEQGINKFHVVSDFDRTVTYGLTGEGKRTSTVISQLRSTPKYLGKEYMDKAHKLFDIYHPIEIDPNISLEEKKEKMHEWWEKHFNLIARHDFTKQLIEKVVRERPLKFRQGSSEFVDFLNKRNIPLIFMSAAPGDMIIEYLKQNNLMLDNIYIVANRYKFGAQGKALRIKEPIIHTFNKEEVSLKGTLAYEAVKDRKNVLLLGDSIGDIGMVEGFPYETLIKIGFLNEEVEENLKSYGENFDVILLNDTDFSFINKLLEEIL